MTTASGVWYNLALTVAGNKITAAIDGAEVAAYTDASPVLAGRVDLASGFYYTSFDNLLVEKLEAYVPYYSERLDSLETHDLASPPNTKLVYTGDWYHRNGEGMYNYQRSLSSSAGVGASVAYTFTGTGFDIMANNSSSATLQLTIDGHKVSSAEKNWPTSAYWRTSYSLRGLPLAQHTVELEVLAGTLVIDSFDTVAGPVADPESIDLTPVTDALAATADVIKTENFSDAQWAAFQAMRAHAAAAAADSAAYGLDAEGPVEIAARLGATALPGAWVLPAVSTATWKGQAPELPTTLEATEADEGITSTFPITWDLDGVSFNTAWSTVTVTGRYQHLETTATVEVVPEGLVYFADLNGVASGLGAGTSALGYTSPAYLAIAGLADSAGQPLLNDKPDQVYSAESGWGHQAYQSNGTTSSIAYKGVVAGAYDKATTTGIYSGQNSTGALTTYTFSLPAGSYALAFMSYSWWASSSRTTQVYIDYGATRSTTVLDTFTLSTSANTSGYLGAFPVDLESAGEVTLRLRATNAQAPMLSWAAVYQVIPTAVAVNPAVATVAPGRAAPFTGTVTLSTGATNTDVDWSVTGATSADTSITDGVLSLGLDEPAGTVLTVTAAAAADPGKTASATVTVAVDKSELTALAAEAGVLEEDFYTADSWAGLAPVLVEAADVIGDLDATQAAVDGALAALQSAVEGLELKVVGLEVVAPPTRTVYVASPDGGELDLDGLAVRFVHADQSTSAVLAAGAYEVSGFSLAEPGAQEVTVSAGAQGQVFEAGFEIVVNSPELSLGVVVSIRCVSGKAYLGVQVTNTDTVPADLVLTSQFGSKAFSVVAVGKKATHNFTTALASIGDGSVSVRGVGSGGGAAAPVADRSVGYVPASCAS
ncbi:MAG: hypothetical protein LBG60_09050 [Bifidobacteriaceae bacterium]|jgi:hypothetical protein|nr:hypothetical protein [Bifidobacteriaceae bacterium]